MAYIFKQPLQITHGTHTKPKPRDSSKLFKVEPSQAVTTGPQVSATPAAIWVDADGDVQMKK